VTRLCGHKASRNLNTPRVSVAFPGHAEMIARDVEVSHQPGERGQSLRDWSRGRDPARRSRKRRKCLPKR
jgi:hypothetical protein